ncbi:MAG: cation diffusion facilitator family transporter [Acidimicrobiia bacterium]|nr:cation diffusion facilitator family transporter [Acidimicrobiia bacterium]
MATKGSRTAVVAALTGNSLIAVAKFVAAGITGSVAMLSEAWHSVADTGNQALLLRGLSQSKRPSDAQHPFGRGKETYFWSFMVAVMLFVGGAVLSIQHGIEALRHPHELEDITVNVIVLGVALVIEGSVFLYAYREFKKEQGSRSIWQTFRGTKDTAILVVLLEDAAAMLGLLFALAGVFLSAATSNSVWDAVASLMIGALLAIVAVLLAIETKALLIGEAASRSDRAAIMSAVLAMPAVTGVGRLLTMHMGPDKILVNVEVEFVDGLDDTGVEAAIDDVEAAIRETLPSADNIFVELETVRRG